MQNKIFPAFMALSLLAISVSAQNIVSDANAEIRQVGEFNKIKISGAITVYLSQGTQQGVAISSESGKYNSKIKTEVSGGILKVYVEGGAWNNWNWGNKDLTAYITITKLETLDINGASAVKIADPISVTNINIEINGASTLKGAIKAIDMQVEVTGASVADLTGNTTNLDVKATGASNFKGFGLPSAKCKAEASGASSIAVSVSDELDADANGASSIGYKGEAKITRLDVSGASSVKKKS